MDYKRKQQPVIRANVMGSQAFGFLSWIWIAELAPLRKKVSVNENFAKNDFWIELNSPASYKSVGF
jgi:hypothetical protein